MSVVLFFVIRHFLETYALSKGHISKDVNTDTTETTLFYEYSKYGSVFITYNYRTDDLEIEWGDETEYIWPDVYIGTIEEFEAGFEAMKRDADNFEATCSENDTDVGIDE